MLSHLGWQLKVRGCPNYCPRRPCTTSACPVSLLGFAPHDPLLNMFWARVGYLLLKQYHSPICIHASRSHRTSCIVWFSDISCGSPDLAVSGWEEPFQMSQLWTNRPGNSWRDLMAVYPFFFLGCGDNILFGGRWILKNFLQLKAILRSLRITWNVAIYLDMPPHAWEHKPIALSDGGLRLTHCYPNARWVFP